MCVVQKPEEQYKVMLQVGLPGRGGEGAGASPGGRGPMEGRRAGGEGYGSISSSVSGAAGVGVRGNQAQMWGRMGVPAWRSGVWDASLRCSIDCEASAGSQSVRVGKLG